MLIIKGMIQLFWYNYAQFVYEPAQIQTHGLPERIEEGVAIFSRHPIVDHATLLLSRDVTDVADTHQRILLDASVQLPHIGLVRSAAKLDFFFVKPNMYMYTDMRVQVRVWVHLDDI